MYKVFLSFLIGHLRIIMKINTHVDLHIVKSSTLEVCKLCTVNETHVRCLREV